MGLYTTAAGIARFFGMAPPTVYDRLEGIRKEIESGRYNEYAISDRQINKAVFLDYNKYHKILADKNLRKNVPAFDIRKAREMLDELGTEGISHEKVQ